MKKLTALILTLFLCSACTLSSFADVWIPPTDDGGYCPALIDLPGSKGEEFLNRFVSEFLHSSTSKADIFANCEWCFYNGSAEYDFSFNIYQTTAAPEDCYALQDPSDAENALRIGRCSLQIRYDGDMEATTFSDSNFTLIDHEIYFFTEEEIERANGMTAQPDMTEEFQDQPIPEITAITETQSVPETSTETDSTAESGFWTTGTILLAAGVAVLALGAVLAIALIFRKKR